MMFRYRSRSGMAAIVSLALVVVGACGGAADGESTDLAADQEAPDTSTGSVDTTVAADSAAGPSPRMNGKDPLHGFELPSAGEPLSEARIVRLLLRNASDEPAVVYGDGGAGEVLLDTVPPHGEQRVDVTTRAVRLALRSETASGEALRRDEVSVGVDSVLAVSVGAVTAAP